MKQKLIFYRTRGGLSEVMLQHPNAVLMCMSNVAECIRCFQGGTLRELVVSTGMVTGWHVYADPDEVDVVFAETTGWEENFKAQARARVVHPSLRQAA